MKRIITNASVPGSIYDFLILPGISQGGVTGMSEKCDRRHLKVARLLFFISPGRLKSVRE